MNTNSETMSQNPPLPPKAVALFKQYLTETPKPVHQLAAELDAYLEFVGKAASRNEGVQWDLAQRLTDTAKALLTAAPEGKHMHAQAAARYLIEDLDADDDLVGSDGFEDDRLMLNAVAHHFGRPDLVVD